MQLPLNINLIQHILNSSTVTGDLNNLMNTGFYYVQSPINAPTSTWPHVFVNANDNKTKIVQLALPDSGNEGLYYRCYVDTSWGEWLKLAAPDDIANALATANAADITSKQTMKLVTQLNNNLGIGSEWSKAGLISLNGFNSTNLCWRKYQAKGLTIVEFAGYCTTATVKTGQTVELVQVSDEIKSLIGSYFAECGAIEQSPASTLTYNQQTGKIVMHNGYNFDLSPFDTSLSLLIVC